jgi:hypothetical protein
MVFIMAMRIYRRFAEIVHKVGVAGGRCKRGAGVVAITLCVEQRVEAARGETTWLMRIPGS